jgi:hypothetical protein
MNAPVHVQPAVDDPVLAAFLAAPLAREPLSDEDRAEILASIARVESGEKGIPGDVVSAKIAAAAR